MAMPDKPIEIDLDALGIDAWIEFTGAASLLQQLKGSDLATMHQALSGARQVLVTFLTPSWSEEEIGALNLGEMKAVFGQIGAAMRGPNATSGTPSTPRTNTEGHSPSAPASRGRPRNGTARRGRLRPPSA